MGKHRISIDQGIHFGLPCVAGTRIPVYCVLELVESGVSFPEIVSHYYPELTVADVKACVGYALDLVRNEEVHVAERIAS